MRILAVIPARYASTRLPGKPLLDIGGKPMVVRVYEQVAQCAFLHKVLIATDDERILQEAERFGARAVLTASLHSSGTERCAEVAASNDADVILNIQGDEPFIQPSQIELLANCFQRSETQIATLVKRFGSGEELSSPSRVKVVLNKRFEALYFSRSIIPFARQELLVTRHSSPVYYQHIGLYGFRKDILLQVVKLPESMLEKTESLEQLRWLENGYRVQCAITEHESMAIDTPEDYERAKLQL